MNRLIAGFVSGVAATAPMTASMATMFNALPFWQRYLSPPRQITHHVLDEVGLLPHLEEVERKALSGVAHFGYGGVAGALYALTVDRIPASPVTKGVGYGLAVWAGSYLGLLPALGILLPATRHPNKRTAMMIAAHVVWGSTLGILTDRFEHRRRGPIPRRDRRREGTRPYRDSADRRAEVYAGDGL